MTEQDPTYETIDDVFEDYTPDELRLVKDNKTFWVNERTDSESERPPYDEELLWVWDSWRDDSIDLIIRLFAALGMDFECNSLIEKQSTESSIEASVEIWPNGNPLATDD